MGPLLTLLVSFLLRTVVIKFVFFTAMYVLITGVTSYLLSKMPGPADLNSSLAALTPGMWFFLDLTLFPQFFPALISALILRFVIRRIPGFG